MNRTPTWNTSRRVHIGFRWYIFRLIFNSKTFWTDRALGVPIFGSCRIISNIRLFLVRTRLFGVVMNSESVRSESDATGEKRIKWTKRKKKTTINEIRLLSNTNVVNVDKSHENVFVRLRVRHQRHTRIRIPQNDRTPSTYSWRKGTIMILRLNVRTIQLSIKTLLKSKQVHVFFLTSFC